MASPRSVGTPGPAISRRTFLRGALAVRLAAGYPFAIERYLVSVNHYEVPIDGLPGEFEGFRIVHLTDLHYGSLVPLSWISGVLDQALREDGDLIVLTGDYVHARDTPTELETVWPELLRLDARHGVGMVLGNHDHWADSARALLLLSESGRSLRNRSRVIRRGGAGLAIAGVGDFWEDEVSIDAALAGVDPSTPRIVLAHNPDCADLEYESRVDLFVCGHTHGGQVRVPFVGSPILPVTNRRYDQGLRESGHAGSVSGEPYSGRSQVFVNRGIGWAVVPVRFNCPPEIAVLHLTRGRGAGKRAKSGGGVADPFAVFPRDN